MIFKSSVAVAAFAFACGGLAVAADAPMTMNADQVQWGPGPPSLPPGSQVAVMAGDPASNGFVSMRAKLSAGYTVPPHTHPTDEHVTVLSGTMAFGMGDTIDPKNQQEVTPGGYFTAKTGMHHYAVAKTDALIQIDMMGPFGITYLNPADDPRNGRH